MKLFKFTSERGIVAIVGLLAVLFVANTIVSYLNIRTLRQNASLVAHTLEVSDALEDLGGTVTAAETGERGFLLSGDERFLEPYKTAVAEYRQKLDRIDQLTADNPQHLSRMPELRRLVTAKFDKMSDSVARMEEKRVVEARELVRPADGRTLMNDTLKRIDAMKEEERRLLHLRERATDRAFVVAIGASIAAGILGLTMLGMFIRLWVRAHAVRTRSSALIFSQRETLQATLASIGDGVIVTDASGRVTFINAVASRLSSWDPTEAQGRPLEEIFRIVNENTRLPVERPVERLLRGSSLAEMSNHPILISKDGDEWPIENSAAPIRNKIGTLAGTVLVFHEISERKKAEEQLRASEQQFRAVFETAAVGMVQVDAATMRYLLVNDTFCAITGFSREELLGKTFLDLGYPTEQQGDAERYQRLLQGESHQYRAEKRYIRKNGDVIWVEVTASILGSEGPTRTMAIIQDVTARKRAADEFRWLADSIPQLAWMARPDGNTFWYNQRWYDYTGATPQQMEGWGWKSVQDPVELPRVMAAWERSLATGEPFDLVFPLRGADGSFRPFLTRVAPFKDENGRIVYWFGTNTDISEIREAEERLKEADRRKDEFLATLAHELRNPLAPIRTSVHLLGMMAPSESRFSPLRDMIERQVKHMVRLVDDLLDVSRITRNKIELRKERLDLSAVVQSAVETSRPLIEASRHELSVRLPKEPLYVEGDLTRLAQIVSNLLNNAAKYTPEGGKIGLSVEREDKSEAVIRVSDTGTGIPADMLGQVFDMFTQVKHAVDRSQGGLGIGLTLVKRLVELHGGTVTAHSSGPGQGSEFVIRLPLVEAAPPVEEIAGKPSVNGPGLRLMVVDDNVDAAESLAMLLRLRGHDVHTSHDGRAALADAATFQPDAIVLDLGMPGIDGFEVARQLRSMSELNGVKLVALTGWGQEEDRRQTQAAGFDAHMIKPVDAIELESLLRSNGTMSRKGDATPGRSHVAAAVDCHDS